MGKVRDDDPAKLTDFKLVSFDVYSTLIDEKGRFFPSFLPSFLCVWFAFPRKVSIRGLRL
jgi:hypothetical protein